MADRVLWNCYEVEPVEAGGFVVVHRHTVDRPRAGALVSLHGTTMLAAYYPDRPQAEEHCERFNSSLGFADVPRPVPEDDQDEDDNALLA